MKIFAMCPIYDDVQWLQETIEGAYPEVDRIYLFVADKPWHGQPRRPGAVLRAMKAISQLSDPDLKIEILHDIWPNEETTRNEAMRIFREAGADYCMFLDSDEIWDPDDLRRARAIISAGLDVQYWYIHWYVYWKTREYRIAHEGCPLVFVKLDGQTKIQWLRAQIPGNRQTMDRTVASIHHMSYAHSDEEIRNKIANFQGAYGVNGTNENWFELVWKAWDQDHDLRNLHPVRGDAKDFECAVRVTEAELPPGLRR
jgi:glycosyltransferase involved in cell wall biosynthesis